jgi:hypothetical protein
MNDMFETQLDRIEAKLDELLARKKKPVKAKSAQTEYPGGFEEAWKLYPKRAGNNPKNQAFEAWCARLKQDKKLTDDVMIRGVQRYRDYCLAMRTTGTGLVMHGSTFFGPSDPPNYLLDWTIPKAATRKALPRNDEDLESFAVEMGLHERGNAPAGIDYRQYRQWIQERL